MKTRELIRNKKGLTLVETLLAVAMAGILSLAVFQLHNFANKAIDHEEESFEKASDEILIGKRLSMDLQLSNPSFNNIVSVQDDHGKGFFDLITDFQCASDCTRTLTLKTDTDQDRREVVLLLEDTRKQPAIMFPPSAAYSAGPSSFLVSGTLSFQSVNQNDFLDQVAPGLYVPGRLLMFYTPVELRPSRNATAAVDVNTPAKRHYFIGKVTASEALTQETFGGVLRTSHPLDPSVTVDSIDKFFRTMPPMGGQAAFAFVNKVEFVRYQIEKVLLNGKRTNRVVRQKWDANQGNFESPGTMLGAGVRQLIFKRPSITSPVVEFGVVKE